MPPRSPAKLFSEWIANHSRGNLDAEVTAAVAEVTQAVTHLNRAGSVTIRLDVTNSGDRTVLVAGTVTSKVPKPDAEAAIFFPDEEGGLHTADPYQERMDLDDRTGELGPGHGPASL